MNVIMGVRDTYPNNCCSAQTYGMPVARICPVLMN